MVVGMPGGGISAAASLAAVTAIILTLLLTRLTGVAAAPFVTVVCLFHTVSMLVTYRMPWLIRSMTTSGTPGV